MVISVNSRCRAVVDIMTRKARRRKPKPPRKCIFCGKGGTAGNPMTEEHLWPEWMHPYLPKLPNPEKQEVFRRVRMNKVVEERRQKVQQGHTYTSTFKVVCKQCNGGWMGDIEEDAKPILIPLLRGLTKTLDLKDQIKLTRWLALKTRVTEQKDPSEAVFSQEARTTFMINQRVPSEIRISLFSHDVADWYFSWWHQTLVLTLEPDPPATGRLKNVQTTALGVGHLFSFAFVTTVQGFTLNLEKALGYFMRQLWPTTHETIAWPPPNFPDPGGLAHHLDHLMRSPMATWRPLTS